MIGQTTSLAKTSDAAAASSSPTQQKSLTKTASPDQELIAMAQNFRASLHAWIDQVSKHNIESYDTKTEEGRALYALRVEWGNALLTLRNLAPQTVAGALEKLSAAQVFLTFSCEAEGFAIELLALATRELDQVCNAQRTSDQTQTSRRPRAHGPFWWLQKLTQRR